MPVGMQHCLQFAGRVGCNEFLKIEWFEVRCVFEPFFLQGLESRGCHVLSIGVRGKDYALVAVFPDFDNASPYSFVS